MLTRSLCCFRGISAEAERKLWRAGCLSWGHLPQIGRALSPCKAADLAMQLPELRAALGGRVVDYFLKRLPVGNRLRILPEFADGVAFLDVETTGLGIRDELTVVRVWQAGQMRQFVQGRDLCDLLGIWRKIDVLVTFNGERFDLPMLARAFGLGCMPPHIDLLREARVYGYTGGLKVIERMLGICRDEMEEGDGETAVRLWRRYVEQGDADCLARLLRYNAKDILSVIDLSAMLWKRSFDGYTGPVPVLPMSVRRMERRSLTSA